MPMREFACAEVTFRSSASKLEKKGFETRVAGQKIRQNNNFTLSVSEARG